MKSLFLSVLAASLDDAIINVLFKIHKAINVCFSFKGVRTPVESGADDTRPAVIKPKLRARISFVKLAFW